MERLCQLLVSDKPQTWLFCGASVTHGALHTHGYRDYSQIFNERLRFELRRHMDVVINTGVSGDTTAHILENFERRIACFKPQVVSLMIGLNDINPERGVSVEAYRENLNNLADRISGIGALALFQTCNTMLPNAAPAREGNFKVYMQTLREVAQERGLPLLDQAVLWEEELENQTMWMNDGVHPNHFGHLFMAINLFKALRIYDPEGSYVCRHYLPMRIKG